MTKKRFTWEYSHHDSTGEIIDWIRNECLMTDYLQKYELEEWCQELNKIVDENNQLRKENGQLKQDRDEMFIRERDTKNEWRKLKEENEQLKETIKELELENAKHIGDGEWDIRDITYGHGKFRLEEWGERYHQFYDDDKALEDEEVVSLLFENEQLKEELGSFEQVSFTDLCDGSRTVLYMKKENIGDSE